MSRRSRLRSCVADVAEKLAPTSPKLARRRERLVMNPLDMSLDELASRKKRPRDGDPFLAPTSEDGREASANAHRTCTPTASSNVTWYPTTSGASPCSLGHDDDAS